MDADLYSDLPGLFAAVEVVGGISGANRVSGNAITEALTFGLHAGGGTLRVMYKTTIMCLITRG
ncbi:MAG: hypothetical protein ACSLEN_07030 [Candidatus Malihini olakiniferum]